ncbi:flavin oxidoreductase [Pseudoalteromonas phenolica]|uniref:Flavin oxidoreductase n=1 Tax=Pseudoalteromonas phenolica TaxID=161398 RepID=A0A5R9Q670_9GAMM|nr:flavin reductase [Pseudoalteromonas phenolica]TLX48294.1 flavin oxidoreductase [Pseudoalteromonas phenolica]
MFFNTQSLNELEQRYRAHLINSLSGFKSANLLGTVDKNGQENLSIVSSVFHLGANPALFGMIIRPHSVPRHSFENLLETGFYTLNHVNEDIVTQAHQTSARYEKEQSEFTETGLTPEYLNNFKAPFVKESKIKMGLKLVSEQVIELNQTHLVIGEMISLHCPDSVIQPDGFIDIEAANTVAITGLDSYHTTCKINRLSYAKPDSKPKSLVTL